MKINKNGPFLRAIFFKGKIAFSSDQLLDQF